MVQVLFGSTPNHPDPGRCWRVIEKYQVRRQRQQQQRQPAAHVWRLHLGGVGGCTLTRCCCFAARQPVSMARHGTWCIAGGVQAACLLPTLDHLCSQLPSSSFRTSPHASLPVACHALLSLLHAPAPVCAPWLQVRVMYTAPTLLRSLMQYGDEWVASHNRSSLRILGTVGEPINPHAWNWFNEVRGPCVPC